MNIFEQMATDYSGSHPVGVLLPEVSIPEKYYTELGLSTNVSNYELLRSLCWKGVLDLGINQKDNAEDYYERLKYELSIMDELGFVDYILLNWDVLQYCHEEGIPTGFGRGSAAGSLVLYVIGVTKIDSLAYDLIFERFVSKARSKSEVIDGKRYFDGGLLPDVDNDIAFHLRKKVVNYINEKHEGKTARILTFNTLTSKLCIKESLKIIDEMSEERATHVSDGIPKLHGKLFGLKNAIDESPSVGEYCEKHKVCFNESLKIEGLIKNRGVHPSGIAICDQKINNLMSTVKTKDGELATGYDMDDVNELCVKFDILGLRTLSVVHNACEMIGVDDFTTLDVHDPEIYEYFQDFENPQGLFQIESWVNGQVCGQVKPVNLEQLSDVIALARPGALSYVSQYIANSDDINYFENDSLEAILKPTGGVPLYQEQAMSIAHKVFYFTLDDAELIRKAVGKKLPEKMKPWEDKIYTRAKERSMGTEIADFYWKLLDDSASYSFNKSHSVAYGHLTAITTYLKKKHPLEFFIALLNMTKHEQDSQEEVAKIVKELPFFNIQLLPPSFEHSGLDFQVEGKNIRYGLQHIKGISEGSIEKLLNLRSSSVNNKYEMFLSSTECGLNIASLSSLISCGIFDKFEPDRCKLILEAQIFNGSSVLTAREKENFVAFGPEFNYDVLETMRQKFNKTSLATDGKPLFMARKNSKRIETITKKLAKYKQIYLLNSQNPDLTNWFFERKMLGYSFSTSLKDVFARTSLSTSREVNKATRGNFSLIGEVVDVWKKISQNTDKEYCKIAVTDDFGTVQSLLIDSQRNNHYSNYVAEHDLPEKGDIIFIEGSKNNDTLFINKLNKLNIKVFFKTKDLNDSNTQRK